MTSENTSEDLHQGRGWLNRAAEMLDSCEDHVSDAEFARAAAAIGNGFIQLAAVEQWAAARAEDLACNAERRAEDAPLTAAMVDAHSLAAELAQRQLDAINAAEERGGGLVATVRQRKKRAEAEARPHDEPLPGHMACEFVVRGLRCVLGLNHTPGHHTLQDGSYVDEDGHRLEEIPEADRG